MAETPDVNTLKRRGRRRLVGAIALVLLAVIVLPMVFDTEPGQSSAPVSVRIPSEDTPFSPSVQPKPAPAPAVEVPKPPAEATKPPPRRSPPPNLPSQRSRTSPRVRRPPPKLSASGPRRH